MNLDFEIIMKLMKKYPTKISIDNFGLFAIEINIKRFFTKNIKVKILTYANMFALVTEKSSIQCYDIYTSEEERKTLLEYCRSIYNSEKHKEQERLTQDKITTLVRLKSLI